MTDRADLPARLRERLRLRGGPESIGSLLDEAAARIEALEAALKPFADLLEASIEAAKRRGENPDKPPDAQIAISFTSAGKLTVGDFRTALRALTPESPQ